MNGDLFRDRAKSKKRGRSVRKAPPSDTIKAGPGHVLLWKQTKYGPFITIRSLEIDPTEPSLEQVQEWASAEGFEIVEHREMEDIPWPAIFVLRKIDEPWRACAALRRPCLTPVQ